MQENRETRAAAKKILRLSRLETLLRRTASRKNRVVSIIVLALVPAFVLWIGVQVLRAREATAKIETENKRIQQQIVELNAQSKEYLAVLSDKDPEAFRDYVIRIAREQLGLSLPGDQVFVDRSFVQTPQK